MDMKFAGDDDEMQGFAHFLACLITAIDPDINFKVAEELLHDMLSQESEDITEEDLEEIGALIRMSKLIPKAVQ